MDSYRAMLQTAPRGSIVVLHACAHNPTGCDPSEDEWREIGLLMKERELFPLFDAAYLGFNSGNIDQDAFAIRHFVEDLKIETAVCLSFAKNMGLYGMDFHKTSACLLWDD
jgi:aspartate aminotransferase